MGTQRKRTVQVKPEIETAFLKERWRRLSSLFSTHGIQVELLQALNCAANVIYVARCRDAESASRCRQLVGDLCPGDIGGKFKIVWEYTKAGEGVFTFYIAKPTPDDAYLRDLLGMTDPQAVAKMRSPFLVGESLNGEAVWVDLKDNGFLGGGRGVGKTARVKSGLAAALHVKKPGEIQYLVNAWLIEEYDFLVGSDYCRGAAGLTAGNIDAIEQNLKIANAEWKRREQLFEHMKTFPKTLEKYNAEMCAQGHPEWALPQLQVIMDDLEAILVWYPNLEQEVLWILKNGAPYGVSILCVSEFDEDDLSLASMERQSRVSMRMGKWSEATGRLVFSEESLSGWYKEFQRGDLYVSERGECCALGFVHGAYATRESLKWISQGGRYPLSGLGAQMREVPVAEVMAAVEEQSPAVVEPPTPAVVAKTEPREVPEYVLPDGAPDDRPTMAVTEDGAIQFGDGFFSSKLKCRKCKKTFKVAYRKMVDVTWNGRLKFALLKGTYFRFTCPFCGEHFSYTFRMMVCDSEKGYLIRTFNNLEMLQSVSRQHASTLTYDIDIVQNFFPSLSEVKLSSLRCRLVLGANGLMDKIRVFEAGLDDYAIESCKIVLLAQAKLPGEAEALFFNGLDDDGTFSFHLCLKDGRTATLKAPRDVYDGVKKQIDETGSFREGEMRFVDYSAMLSDPHGMDTWWA